MKRMAVVVRAVYKALLIYLSCVEILKYVHFRAAATKNDLRWCEVDLNEKNTGHC